MNKSNLLNVPKKQRRMLERLMRDSLTGTSLQGAPSKDAAWDKMLAKASIKRP